MNLTSPRQVKEWCAANGFKPNRVLGQNFLIDRNALLAIASAGLDGAPDSPRVLEVGPGLGVLTAELLSRGARVVAVEKDPVLAGRLSGALGSPASLRVLEGDALAYVERGMDGDVFDAMVSNLPYQCGTRILLELVARRAVPRITALVQTEVAERLAAKEGSRTRSLSGVWAQLDYDVTVVRKVSATCFWPRPEVGSSVVRLVRHDRYASLGPDFMRRCRAVAKKAFSQRRKQLGSVFRDLVESTARAEELSVPQWIELTKGIADEHT